MPTELGQLLRLVLLMGLIKAACAHNYSAMATINCPITDAYVTRVEERSIINIKLGAKIPSIKYDAATKTVAESETDEIQLSFKAFVAQVVKCRPEVGELFQVVQFAKNDEKARKLASFIRIVTRDAAYDVDAVLHTAGQKFDNGTVARFDGYTYNIIGAKFSDTVEARLQPRSLDDDLAEFGR